MLAEHATLYCCHPPTDHRPLPPPSLPQELRLGTAALSHLDLENCGHLREVQLSEGASRASLDGGSQGAEASGERGAKVRVRHAWCLGNFIVGFGRRVFGLLRDGTTSAV